MNTTLSIAFFAGVISFLSPCVLPLIPGYISYISGSSLEKLIEKNVIEIAPLAYTRGRTLNHSFIILDEAQNTTIEQMKMFLTRLGFGSKVVITGDITQIDLPSKERSGLVQALKILKGIILQTEQGFYPGYGSVRVQTFGIEETEQHEKHQ